MSFSPERNNHHHQQPPPLSKKRLSWRDVWLNDQQALTHAALKMRLHSPLSSTPPSDPDETLTLDNPNIPYTPDPFSLLSDELLLSILSKLPASQHVTNSAVNKRWLKLNGRFVQSIKLLDWEFLESGRLTYRFPNLTDIDLVRACVRSSRNSGIVFTHSFVSFHLDSSSLEGSGGFLGKHNLLHSREIDRGVRILSEGCRNLRRVVVISPGEETLLCVAEECLTLQELELHCCADLSLRGISGCRNLQILKLIGCVDGFYDTVVSDIGLTIVAQGCKRLVKLELVGCEGSYDGIKAIGQCCQMLEELTLCDHRMEGGWLAALSYCTNLKTLRLQGCKNVDTSPGDDEHLGSCPALEELHLQQCHLRDKQGVRALFLVCGAVRELVFKDCWGLEDSAFGIASICRGVKSVSLEGCSLLTMEGLDAVVISWKELKRLRVVSCNNIKDSEITPALASLFSTLKGFKWQPDSRSLLSSGLAGTGMGKKGGRAFKRV
ncbi:F-box protein At5g51370-like [Rhododendron vialii]|uniref:F-box protein At5g51370-like n=1 Tax=Rhododendron vialii TaxID=182163 RepID=UPI00265E15D9|nr:F-box protein At5g51370-like [Rhododendron vialii]